MPKHRKSRSFQKRLAQTVFESTGLQLKTVLKTVAIMLIAAVGIGWTLLSTSEQNGTGSEPAALGPKELTNEQKFRDVSMLPGDFPERLPVEQISILNSKIEYGEQLANSGGSYADQANDLLLSLYGTRCSLEETEGLNSDKTYRRLAELRQTAVAAGNERRVAKADFLRARAATNRLKQRTERADFRFAADAILNLDSKYLVKTAEAQQLFIDAVSLHSDSSDKDSTGIFLSLIADKLVASPEIAVSSLGLNLKDYPRYFRYYKAVAKQPDSTRESRVQFYDELFAAIDEAPPQSPNTYRIIIKLVDRLLNTSDAQNASRLTKRLSKAASMAGTNTKAQVDQSIENIETRIAMLGETLDLSGSTFDEKPLRMPNGKPTIIVFWRPSHEKSKKHIVLLAESEWFDPWESNVLVACPSRLSEKQLKNAGTLLVEFKVLDNETSIRLATDIGIDLLPYQVSLDKDNKVIRLGAATD